MKTETKVIIITGAIIMVSTFLLSFGCIYLIEAMKVGAGLTLRQIQEVSLGNSIGTTTAILVILRHGMKRNRK